jgi:WS/DGAT/MGAT family acyltransferase
MALSRIMQNLTELDASFLFLESEKAPLYAGGLYIFKKSSSRSRFNFDRFKDLLEDKLSNEDFFRKRLVSSSYNQDLPIWADDPQFSLNNHLQHIQLDKFASPCDLNEITAEILNTPFNKQHPLWQAVYIDGLSAKTGYNKECFALILKVHISALDSTTGEDILSQLLTVNPEKTTLSEKTPWSPMPLPANESILEVTYNAVLSLPNKLAFLTKDTVSSAFYRGLYDRLQELNLPASLLSIAGTPMNKKVTSQRILNRFQLPLNDVRQIRKSMENVTTNDILMGICAEALAIYLKEQGKMPKAPLIALSPISVRSTSLDIKSGSQLSASLFSLATDESDPIKRIHAIHQTAQSQNHYQDAISANRLTELIPSSIAALSARVYSDFSLAQRHKPMFNLPIVNIPGPQFPLYMEDNELLEYSCSSPLFDGIGLTLTVISYNSNYHINATYCPDLLNTKASFNSYLEKALDNIRAHQHDEVSVNKEDHEKNSMAGIIDDIGGLVNSLLGFGSK